MSRKQKKNLYRIITAATIFIILYFIPVKGLLRLILYFIPYIIVGFDILFGAFRNILSGQVFDEKFLMTVATLGAFTIGEYPEATAVMLFYQVGELFQSLAVGKSRKSISALMNIRPETATVIRDGNEIIISPEEVAVGEILIIRAGERIPLDGIVIEGTTAVDTSSLTGESLPADKTVGDKVISGTVNLSGLIKVKTIGIYTESTVAKILELTENAAEKKAKTENFITRFARYYTPFVVISACVLAVLPPLITGDWLIWINRALIFLVVSCPCALVVSVPLSFFSGIGAASKHGILIKGAIALEELAEVKTVVFDKTGTLTKGSFTVTEVYSENFAKEKLVSIAAAAESHSNHPIARCIADIDKGDNNLSVNEVKEIAGLGIMAVVEGQGYHLGNSALMKKLGVDFKEYHLGGTVIYISREKQFLGYIVINDEIKADTPAAIREIKKIGIKRTVMLTGDTKETAGLVANNTGIDEFCAELLPKDKVDRLEEMLEKGEKIAFIGDGINDAPVLTRADVGIAMGTLGSDAAIEAADIVIMDDKLSKLSLAVGICRKTMKIVRQNIIFALGVKVIILLLGAFGIANMWIAVFGDVGVTVIAIINAMSALYVNKQNV